MKKTIIGLLLFLSASLCFAKGVVDATKKELGDNIEVGVGYHSMIHTATRDFTKGYYDNGNYVEKEFTDDITNIISSIAINLAYNKFYTDEVGFGLYLNFFFPKEGTIIMKGESETFKWEYVPIAMDLLIGPIFSIYESENIFVSFATGIHWTLFYGLFDGDRDKVNYRKILSNQIGLGTNITGEYYLIPDTLYVYARFQLGYDFYSFEMWGQSEDGTGRYKEDKGNRNGFISAWSISPCIGIGFVK